MMIREQLSKIWTSLQKPVSLFLSVVGVFATLYFGLKAPDWIEGRNAERARRMNEELIETVEDLVLNNQEVTVTQIAAQIRGKVLRYDIPYPYTIPDLLAQVQEDIMETVFIPLEQKVELVQKLEELKEAAPSTAIVDERRKAALPWLLNLVSGILAALAVGVAANGVAALVARHKKERDADVSDRLEVVKDEIAESIRGEVEFEMATESALRRLGMSFVKATGPYEEYDFRIETDTGPIAVECKHRPAGVLLYHPMIQKLIATAMMRNTPYLLVTDTYLTATASRLIEEHNAVQSECQVQLVRGETEAEIEAALGPILKTRRPEQSPPAYPEGRADAPSGSAEA